MSPGATFDRVYLALKERLGQGGFKPGDHLEPAALSDQLNSSVTPVRDALHRLVGERLVAAPRAEGFRVPVLTEGGLRDLYRWNGQLLLLALRRGRRSRSLAGQRGLEPAPSAPGAEPLFLEIAARSGSSEHVMAVAQLNDRLRPYRLTESRLVQDFGGELRAIQDACEAEDDTALRVSLASYHRRRERLAPDILSRMLPPT